MKGSALAACILVFASSVRAGGLADTDLKPHGTIDYAVVTEPCSDASSSITIKVTVGPATQEKEIVVSNSGSRPLQLYSDRLFSDANGNVSVTSEEASPLSPGDFRKFSLIYQDAGGALAGKMYGTYKLVVIPAYLDEVGATSHSSTAWETNQCGEKVKALVRAVDAKARASQ